MLKFPPRDVPLIGQPLTVHPTWILVAPATCNCDAHTPLTIFLGQGQSPAVCPACLNVYGVVRLSYHPGANKGFEMEVGVIGKAQKQVADTDVDAKVKEIASTVN